jgi:8-oxo-dGTP diphosphatase
MWDGDDFSGTKIALLHGEQTLVYLRDDKPWIPFPGMWDLPGGGREGDEDPVACVLREVSEEFGITLAAGDVKLLQRHASTRGGLDGYFCVGQIDATHIASIQFGDEGQRWQLMPIAQFVSHPNAVPHLKSRLKAVQESIELSTGPSRQPPQL